MYCYSYYVWETMFWRVSIPKIGEYNTNSNLKLDPYKLFSGPAQAGPLTWLGVTGDWDKRHKTRHIEKLGTWWVQHSWWEILTTLSTNKCICLYSKCGKVGRSAVLLGWVCAYLPRALWQSHAHTKICIHCLSLPTCKAVLLNFAHLLYARALPSHHKGLWHGLAHVKVFSQSI
jgi:hypothetical protein